MSREIKVLLVEDSEDDALLIERNIRSGGLTPSVERVDTRKTMIEALGRKQWDIIICDHNMPEFSVPEAQEIVRELEMDIPFIIVSGTIDMDLAVEAMKAGARDFVEKGNLARLNPAIEREIRESDTRRQKTEAEEALRDYYGRMAMVLSQTPIVLWSTDKNLKYTSFTGQAGLERLGFTESDVLGKPLTGSAVADNVGEKDTHDIRQFASEALAGQPQEYSFVFGDMVWHSHVEPMRDDAGQIIGVIGVSYDITEETKRGAQLKESERQLRQLSSQLLVAQEVERKRLARNIHDGIGQSLAAIKIRTQNVMQRIETNAPRTPATSLEAILPIIQQTIDEVRRMLSDLHPAILDDFGIAAAIRSYVKQYRVTYPQIMVSTKITVKEDEVPPELNAVIYRIVQESLNNAAKHCRGDAVSISLRKRRAEILLSVADNGCGFNLEDARMNAISRGALGLVSMRERAQLSGGKLTIESHLGQGTAILAVWPVK
jgi:two-component system, NarL family, sensor histidine kinase UhpB